MSSAADVLGISVVHGMRGIGGVCEMCMCLARGVVGGERGEWMRGLGLGFNNHVGTGGVLDVCVFGLRWCRWVGDWTRVWSGGVVLCICEL